MSEFDDLWKFVCKRSACFPVVQEYHELEHVFNLMQGSGSYLEVGTAEGNSLYILSRAMSPGKIHYIDYGEKHTREARLQVVQELKQHAVTEYLGNSHEIPAIDSAYTHDFFECVLIDAGHSYEDVIADAIAYGSLATKYIFFHDVCLPEVNRAFEWYCKQRPECEAYKMINSETFGYGIIKI